MSDNKHHKTKKAAQVSSEEKNAPEAVFQTSEETSPEQISEKEKFLTASQQISEADAELLKQDEDASEKSCENALEQHYMRLDQKIKYKFSQYKDTTRNMSFGEHLKFFLHYYKWNVIICIVLILCCITLGKTIYINSRPMAIGLAILNNASVEGQNLAAQIETDYRSYYEIKPSDRFIILDQLSIDPETYTSEIMATSSGNLTSYENLYAQISAGNIDLIITNENGLLYCIEQDLVYPIENFFDAATAALYEQDIKIYTSYTGEDRQYAVDISQSRFVNELNLGYDNVYLLFPNNTADSKTRAARFIEYIYNYKY